MIKKFLKIIFPYDLPVSKKIFDSWVKILDDTSKAAFLAAGPYFWIGTGSFTHKYESKIVKQEPKEREKP